MAINPRGCNKASLEAKIAALKRGKKPAKRFLPLFRKLIELARHSASVGYCQRAGIELRKAKQIKGWK